MSIMEDINYFYEQYRKNLEEETALSESVFNVETIDEISDALKKRKNGFRSLREKNRVLFDEYYYPIFNSIQNMDVEAVSELINKAFDIALDGYYDYFSGINILLEIEKYYEKLDNPNEYVDKMITYSHIMGYLYNKTSGIGENVLHSIEYYEKGALKAKHYFEIEQKKIRKIILVSMVNYCIQKVNYTYEVISDGIEKVKVYQHELYKVARDLTDFFRRDDVREIDADFEYDIRIDRVYSLVYVCTMLEMSQYDEFDTDFINNALVIVKALYDKELAQKQNEYELSEDTYCSYLICQLISKHLTFDEFVDKYYDYCRYVLEHDEMELNDKYFETRYFTVCTMQLPTLLRFFEKNEISEAKKNEISVYCVEKYLELMEIIPKFGNKLLANTNIEQSVRHIVNYLPPHILKYNFILKTLINRDDRLMIQAIIMRQLAGIVLKAILEEKPELLIGVFGTENIMDVLTRQEEIVDYVRKASQIYDIGKINMKEIIIKETRELSDYELHRIENHPAIGCRILYGIEEMNKFYDVVMGHHKDYDGKGGYPKNYDISHSPVRIIVELIRICDNMNAATDNIDRNYKEAITFEAFLNELKEGAGTKYNPDLVEFICGNETLKNELEKVCVTNRERFYYEAYYEFIGRNIQEYRENEEEKDNLPLWTKNAVRVMEVDFYRDTLKSIYVSAVSSSDRVPDGRFSTYAQDVLEYLVHPDDILILQRLFDYGTLADKLNVNNGSFELEVRIKRDNRWSWIRFHFLVAVEHFGIPKKIHIVLIDADEQCRKRQKLNEALEQAQEEAKTANRAKSMFISNISHEIRTPMNAIVGMVEILLRSQLDETQKSYLNNIKNSGNALLSIINDILDFSKMESGKFEIIDSEYDMLQLLQEISMIFLNRIGEKPVELAFDIDKNIPRVLLGDSLRLRQVIINLMNNAIKFTNQGLVLLKIRVNYIKNDEIGLAVIIKDSGIGIKQEDIGKLFGHFQQIDIKKNYEKEGTGLGLVISKQLVELMGGKISVSSVYGEGSEFKFTVKQKIVDQEPAAKIDKEKVSDGFCVGCLLENELNAKTVEELCDTYELDFCDFTKENRKVDVLFVDTKNINGARTLVDSNVRLCILQNPMLETTNNDGIRVTYKPLFTSGFCRVINNEKAQYLKTSTEKLLNFVAPKAKILIVDDTPMNLTVAKGLLAPLKMQIETADSGMQAIEILQSKDYHMVFMDHKMPGMDGIDTTVCIRTMDDDYYKKIPIIALTANAVLEARKGFYDAGMNDFVAKPIDLNEIISKIKKWLPSELIEEPSEDDLKQNEVSSTLIDINNLHIEGLDVQEGIKNSGNMELFATLVCDYYKLIESKTSKIRDYLAEGMIKEYTIEVHAMKSVSRVVGALDLSEEFKELEALGDKEEIEILYEKTPKVLEHYQQYKEYLKEFVTSRESLKEKNDISKDELIEVLEIMITSMQTCDLDMGDECMNKLDNSDIPENLSDLMEKLGALIADVAMEESIQVMTQMLEILK